MKYTVIFHHTEEGISVSVSGLQGRWSEGDTGEEKFENIQNAIQEYLAAAPSVDLNPLNLRKYASVLSRIA